MTTQDLFTQLLLKVEGLEKEVSDLKKGRRVIFGEKTTSSGIELSGGSTVVESKGTVLGMLPMHAGGQASVGLVILKDSEGADKEVLIMPIQGVKFID